MPSEVKVHDPTIVITGVTVNLDPTNDQVMVASQAAGISGKFSNDLTTGISPAWTNTGFGFNSQGIFLQNEGDELVQVSFDGSIVSFELEPAGNAGAIKAIDDIHFTQIYLRSASGGKTVHVEAW